jgi:hypothetical protein
MFSFIIPRNLSRQLDKTSVLFWKSEQTMFAHKLQHRTSEALFSSYLYSWAMRILPIPSAWSANHSPFKHALTLAPNLHCRLSYPLMKRRPGSSEELYGFLNVALSFYSGLLLAAAVRIDTWPLSNHIRYRSSVHRVGTIPYTRNGQLHFLGCRNEWLFGSDRKLGSLTRNSLKIVKFLLITRTNWAYFIYVPKYIPLINNSTEIIPSREANSVLASQHSPYFAWNSKVQILAIKCPGISVTTSHADLVHFLISYSFKTHLNITFSSMTSWYAQYAKDTY